MPNLNMYVLQSGRIALELLVLIGMQNSNRLKGKKINHTKKASRNNDSPLQKKFVVPMVSNLWFADIWECADYF